VVVFLKPDVVALKAVNVVKIVLAALIALVEVLAVVSKSILEIAF
jgi:hypothetical protein